MRRGDYSALTEKTCSRCGLTKPVNAFGTYRDAKQPVNGWRYYARCRECARETARDYGVADRERRNDRLRDWRSQNRDSARDNDDRKRTKHKYGITVAERERIFEAQDRRCAICGRRVRLVLDHDHATDRVRGGLCNRCNVRLGFIEHEPDPVSAAMRVAPDHVTSVLS